MLTQLTLNRITNSTRAKSFDKVRRNPTATTLRSTGKRIIFPCWTRWMAWTNLVAGVMVTAQRTSVRNLKKALKHAETGSLMKTSQKFLKLAMRQKSVESSEKRMSGMRSEKHLCKNISGQNSIVVPMWVCSRGRGVCSVVYICAPVCLSIRLSPMSAPMSDLSSFCAKWTNQPSGCRDACMQPRVINCIDCGLSFCTECDEHVHNGKNKTNTVAWCQSP